MSDDIVIRLRAYNIGNITHEASSHMEETLYEAADEIERLRAEKDHLWRSFLHYWSYPHRMMDKCPLCDMVSKILNDMLESQRLEPKS